LLVPPSATSIDARTQTGDACLRQIAGLPSQAWVSIVDDRPLSRLRLRRLARRCGLVVERELIVLRTLGAAVAVVEDVGPHAAARVPFSSAPLLRILPWSWTRWLASDRVLLARRR
jgi:hypothetical protein